MKGKVVRGRGRCSVEEEGTYVGKEGDGRKGNEREVKVREGRE